MASCRVFFALVAVALVLFVSPIACDHGSDQSSGQLQDRIAALEAAVLKQQDASAISAVQALYNQHFDALIAYGSTPGINVATNATYQRYLDMLMATFCPEPHFVSWEAWSNSTMFASIPDVSSVRALYQELAGPGFSNSSRHIVTGERISVFVDAHGVTRANFTSSVFQFVVAGGWTSNPGHYVNSYMKQSNGKWCMSRFISYATSFQTYVGTIVAQLDRDGYRLGFGY